jgi:hypothetical protein
MKKIIFGLLILASATACQPELNFLPDSFQARDAEISGDEKVVSLVFLSQAGSASLSFESSKNWTASFVNDRAREWCSIPSESGEKGTYTLTVAVKENTTYDERVAVILLRCEGVQRTIVVTQKQQDALLLSPGHVELSHEGGSFTIEVNTNVDFTFSIPEEASQWLHETGTKGLIPNKIIIEADPNTDLNPRQAVLMVNSALGHEEVAVFQMGEEPALVISSREVLVPTVGGGFEVQITSNLDVEIEFQPASCDWVEEIKSKTISTNTYYFMAAPNETGEAREMFLVFRNAEYELSDELHVRQGALPSFSFTTKRQEVKVPWLTESNDVVRVFWGDGSYQYYAPDLVHSYVEPGMHTVQVEGKTLQPVTISDLEDGMVIDFSLLVKTR